MKTKLTISVETALIPKAKRLASQEGTSLSQLIEEYLKNRVLDRGDSFSQRWRGTFSEADRKGARYQQLAKKYL